MAGDWDAISRTEAPPLWCSSAADERFVSLLNDGDIWHAHAMGVWLDDLLPMQEPK